MSSHIRSMAAKKEGLTRFVKPESPSYNVGGNTVLFPFSYSSQVLDISYAGNSFEADMVDNLNNAPNAETDTTISILGGPQLATSLGENFKAYIRAWRSGTIDAGSPIKVHVAPQVLRVQEAALNSISSVSGTSWNISTSAPASENYVNGDDSNNYHTKYIFKTPLTFSIVEGGVTKYITFRTTLDQE